MPLKPSTISTEADTLLNLLRDAKEISFSDGAKELGVPLETIEAWATFLEEERIVSVKYKFTTPYLAYVEEQHEGKESKKVSLKLFSDRKDSTLGASAEVEQAISKSSEHLKAGEFRLANDTLAVLTNRLKTLIDSVLKNKPKKEEYEAKLNEISLRAKKAEELISQGKFDIAKSIYDETLGKAREILQRAREEKKDQEEAVIISKEKGMDANALLDTAYRLIEQGKLDDAKRLYTQLKSLYYNLPQDFMERKAELEQDLVKLNRDLASNLDRTALKKMSAGTSKIREQMAVAAASIKRRDFQKASEAYEIIKREFENLPEGFILEKKQLREQVISLYEVLAVNRKRMLSAEMSTKTMRINAMLDGIANYMGNGNINGAIALYNQAQALYSSLPTGFLKEKIDLQRKVLKIYYKLSSDYKKLNVRLFDAESAEISKMLSLMQDKISKNNFLEAEKIYGDIKKLYGSLSKGFLQENTELQNRILKAYSDLISKSDDMTAKDVSANISEMNKMLGEAERYLRNRQYGLAESTYSKIISVYNKLPPGFLKSKAELRNRVLSVYREIAINAGQPFVKKSDQTPERAYNEIKRLIPEIRREMAKGNFSVLEADYGRVSELMGEINPDSEEKKRTMMEVARLGEELSLYLKINSIDGIIAQKNFMKLKVELYGIMRLKQRLDLSSTKEKPLLDYVERKLQNYLRVLKGANIPRKASFAKLGAKNIPASENSASINQKIKALKAVSAPIVRNPLGGDALG